MTKISEIKALLVDLKRERNLSMAILPIASLLSVGIGWLTVKVNVYFGVLLFIPMTLFGYSCFLFEEVERRLKVKER